MYIYIYVCVCFYTWMWLNRMRYFLKKWGTVHFIAGRWLWVSSPQDMDGVLYKNAAVEGRIVAQLHGLWRFHHIPYINI